MARKQNTYISADLDWAETNLRAWKKYIDDHPIHKLRDRKDGEKVVAKIEEQIKCIRDTMKEYLTLLEVVNNLREKEAEKQAEVRGGAGLSPLESGDI
jgi:hypothetical protein